MYIICLMIWSCCVSVYCACCLANHSVENRLTDRKISPHFYVNVADIEALETEMAYIACKFIPGVCHDYDLLGTTNHVWRLITSGDIMMQGSPSGKKGGN